MDIYRITRHDPKKTWRATDVRFGTKRRASAIVRQVREDNTGRRNAHESFPEYFPSYQPIQVIIERAPVGGWTDVTGEWFPDDDGEGGVSEPAGDSPDSPPAGGSRLPGGSDDYGALEPTGNATYPWISLSKIVPSVLGESTP